MKLRTSAHVVIAGILGFSLAISSPVQAQVPGVTVAGSITDASGRAVRNNLWTTAGTIKEVFELNIAGVCKTSGYDGGIAAYSAIDASSMTIDAPATSSSGDNDLTLAFSNMPWDSIVTMTGASGITGYYTSVPSLGGYWYPGVPQNLAINVVPTTHEYTGVGVSFQASFAPEACVTGSGAEADGSE